MTASAPMMHTSFTVAQNDAGDWIARERGSAAGRVFPTQKEAIHFALFTLGNGRAAALAMPPRDARGA